MKVDEFKHTPVLLEEVLSGLDLQPDGIYIDATFGRGGHSLAVLQELGDAGRLLAFDKDPAAFRLAESFAMEEKRFTAIHASFSELGKHSTELGLHGKVKGILFDLGVSSPQLDDAARGFSFLRDGALDMRMNPETGMSAAEWINRESQDEIARVLREYGEERFARRIARKIVESRKESRITRTRQLVDLVCSAIPRREKDKHPATRSFQAIRIHVNNELEELGKALGEAVSILARGGRLAVISFHSLEDRIVKRFMRKQSTGDDYPPDLPVTVDQMNPVVKIIGRAIKPGLAEVQRNARSRSAILRVAEKVIA